MLIIQLLIDIILLFIFDFDAIKKKVDFYFPFSLYENRKKSKGDFQLMFASLIIVGDIVLKSLSLIAQLWSNIFELKNNLVSRTLYLKE